jgi:hypothetical protein
MLRRGSSVGGGLIHEVRSKSSGTKQVARRDMFNHEGISRKSAIYSDREVQHRIGVIKDLVEEYVPLIQLARTLPNFISKRLAPPSCAGPDALLLMSDGSEIDVQITTDGENYSTALQCEILACKEIIFPNQSACRDKAKNNVQTKGRILTTKFAITKNMISAVIFAFEKKRGSYRDGSHVLLISTSLPTITLVNNWQELLISSIRLKEITPYDAV